ncbi:MAG: DUF4062 domain-containing protein [Solirubrobacterales bacterium]
MPLLIDTASTSRRLSGDELRHWAEAHTAFVSSEMTDLANEREAVAQALRDLRIKVILFEDFGGRDEDSVTAYLDGVARSDVYIGIVGDRYGRMQASGRSPTHEEYLFARDHGKRISFWVATDESDRQGNARDFVQEVQTFHTTGRFDGPNDLAERVIGRIAELAADDEAPWVKVGDAVLRATVIRDQGDRIEIEADVRDGEIAHYLEGLRPDQWNRASDATVTTHDRSGSARIERVTSEARSASGRSVKIEATVGWADGSADSMAAGTAGYSPEDLAELGLRVGLLGQALPEQIGSMGFMVDDSDPLAELPHGMPEAILQPVARLLIVERLLGQRQATRMSEFSIGPPHSGRRAIRLSYTETRRYSNVTPAQRTLEGYRAR